MRAVGIFVTVTLKDAYRMPTTPRWLLTIPDALTQLETNERPVLTRGDLQQFFGISKPHAATLRRSSFVDTTFDKLLESPGIRQSILTGINREGARW